MARDYDVIVIGGGGAGLAAAVTAHDQGARVALVEADTKLGGSTSLSGGVYYAAGSSVQAERGIADSPDAMFEYYMTLNQYRVEPALARRICDNAARDLEWLQELGVRFSAEGLYASGVESVPRGHPAEGRGQAITDALQAAVSARGIDVALNSRVHELVSDGRGAVTGVRFGDERVEAGSVIVATGGFGANRNMLHELYPEAADYGDDWTWYIGSKHCQGDGIRMGAAVGGDVVGRNRGLLLTTPGFSKDLEVFVPGWLVYVNREGRRFIDETAEYAVMSGAVQAQTGRSCFAIFDDAARAEAKPLPQYQAAHEAGLVLNWITDRLDQEIASRRIAQAGDLASLAKAIGVRPEALKTTVETYNADCAASRDSQFFKDPAVMRPIATPPFYAREIRPAIVCLTSAGLRIDANARVLDRADRPIDGLFAAGETTGGALGERYIGGGNSIANAIVFGRIAGATACAHAVSKTGSSAAA